MTQKKISQLVTPEGKSAGAATSAPGCFIHDGEPLRDFPEWEWAPPFGTPQKGNDVEFYVTGEEYFSAVAKAIGEATESVFITGWQVNFDVELHGGKTLFEILDERIAACATLKVYVMPWLSPQAGVKTGDFDTVMAIFHLNSGRPPPARAFALPAIAQSDMKAALGIGFSHHQKLVVIDQKRAFVGGIDLAYGRRDNGKFSLKHDGREGNELYNPCVPAIHEMSFTEKSKYLTRGELIAGCFEGTGSGAAQFITSASTGVVAKGLDGMKAVSDFKQDNMKRLSDWWNNSSLMPEFINQASDKVVDAAQEGSKWAYRRLSEDAREMLDRIGKTRGANVANAASALVAWLNGASLDSLPADLRAGSIDVIQAFIISSVGYFASTADRRSERYDNLKKLRKMVPPDGSVIAENQPRMPWHDVHSSIKGPAVADLANNFVRRWNSIAHRYDRSLSEFLGHAEVRNALKAIGLSGRPAMKVPRLQLAPRLAEQGTCWVQVLRSAPLRMQQDEELAMAPGAVKKRATMQQNNCLKAMLTAIQGSQKFIYIEGQFFQSAFGIDPTSRNELSGPMAALTDITASPAYEKHAKTLGIYGLPPEQIPAAIRWAKVDDVMRDVNGQGADFMNDISEVIKNVATVKGFKALGPAQSNLENPICEALANRIEAAVDDGLPFHVYMVLPAHPEGTLNTLNIMTQIHLTMQSLIFGNHSLVNRIRRAVAANQLRRKDKSLSREQARSKVSLYTQGRLATAVGDEWKRYLTLINLRNWENIKGRPVTEQIYVHSKLLIADDRVAVLGSANINDRSQLGGRDSELAVIVRDDDQIPVKLDGVATDIVSNSVHDLRVRLWRKLFGLMGGAHPAQGLASVVQFPCAASTVKLVQSTIEQNLRAYSQAFKFLPTAGAQISSIWPTWNAQRRVLDYHMPFAPRFWREDEIRDSLHTWDATKRAPETAPAGIQGFMIALPVAWTEGEKNNSGMNLSILANNNVNQNTNYAVASADQQPAGAATSNA